MQEMQKTQVRCLGQDDPLEGGKGNPLQYSCLGNHGQRSLMGYSPRSCKVSDTTEQLSTRMCAVSPVQMCLC